MHRNWRSQAAILGLAAGLCAGGGRVAAAAELPVADLAEIEQFLAQLNFDPGKIDGVVDERTRTAIRLYQEFAVLPVDGEPSAKLLSELRQVSEAFTEMRTPSPAGAEAAPEPAADAPAPEAQAAESTPQTAPAAETQAAAPAPPAAETAKTEAKEPAPDKADPGQAAPAKAEPRKAPGFSIERMIARLKKAGDPVPPTSPASPTAPAATPERAGYERTLTWQVQNELKRIGLDPGPADGNVREQTNRAIETYQRARGVPVDGRIGEELLARLAVEPAPAAARQSDATPLGAVSPQMAAIDAAQQNGYQAFRAGYGAAQAGDFDTAVKLYDRAVDSGDLALEHLAAALYNRANALQFLGVLDKAIEDYSAAIANKPGFPAAYYNRGFAFDLKGEQIRAVEDFRKARELGLQRQGMRSPDLPPPLL